MASCLVRGHENPDATECGDERGLLPAHACGSAESSICSFRPSRESGPEWSVRQPCQKPYARSPVSDSAPARRCPAAGENAGAPRLTVNLVYLRVIERLRDAATGRDRQRGALAAADLLDRALAEGGAFRRDR